MLDDVIQEVRSRKNFYRDNYRRFLKALMICLALILLLILSILLITLTQGPPGYFATSSDGMLQQIYSAPWGSRLPSPEQDNMPVKKKIEFPE